MKNNFEKREHENLIAAYKEDERLSTQKLAALLGVSVYSARKVCMASQPSLKHLDLLARLEEVTISEFRKLYGKCA